MSDGDLRSYRIALVADRYLNPGKGELDAISVLTECDWGVIQLPSDAYTAETAELLLEQVAEQAEEFNRRGYDLVLVGNHEGLSRAFAAASVPLPLRIEPKTAEELRRFLLERPDPQARKVRHYSMNADLYVSRPDTGGESVDRVTSSK